MPGLILEGRMTVEKAEQILNSWKGHAEHGDSHNFIQSLLDRFKFLYLKKKGNRTVLKIDIAKLKKDGDDIDILQKQKMALV